MANSALVIGVHPIQASEPVHLIELEMEGDIDDFDLGEVTQEEPGQPPSNWQVPYDEREIANQGGRVRYAFFFHFLDPSRPLLSPIGPLALPSETPVPDHLRDVHYEEP